MKILLFALTILSTQITFAKNANLAYDLKGNIDLQVKLYDEDAREMMYNIELLMPESVSTELYPSGEVKTKTIHVSNTISCTYAKYGQSPAHYCNLNVAKWIKAKDLKSQKH